MPGDPRAQPEPCPDEAEIAAFAQGELPPEQAERLEAHLDACEICGQVVAELARIFEGERAPQSAEPAGGSGAGGSGAVDRSGGSGPVAWGQPESPESERGPRRAPGSLDSDELAVTVGLEEEPVERPLGGLLPAGAEVGRYRVLDCVGVGGMGVVYSAYDPELDRRVALKLLRGTRGDAGSQGRNARLLREAQALARLTHPNVITVHDVGTWEGQVFVAMEYVDGPTLKQWRIQQPRDWPQLRDVFVAAGRGLAAAHAADLVHRDFKPDNVLIGKDGRVRVTDFGLARWGSTSGSFADLLASDERLAERLRESSSGPMPVHPEVSLTRTGTLVGTPAYMSPEQHEQQPADAASDQFAFCVALYEAIYGDRPFTGRTLAELASNVIEGRLPSATTPVAGVPRAVRQALRRGLSRQRRDRFGSMEELLAVLDQRPSRRRRGWALLAVPVVGLGVGLWALARPSDPPVGFCGPEGGLESRWGDPQRGAIREAFLATRLSYAGQTAGRTLPAIDQYVARWEQARAQACEPAVTAEDGPAVAALRERCLERRRVSLEALLGSFEQADAPLVGRAVGAVAGLPSVEPCEDRERLVAELPPAAPPELRVPVEALRDELARGAGLIAAGRYHDGLALARRLDARAQALGHAPLQAETQLLLAKMLDRAGEPEAAVEAFEQAGLFASASRHRRILAEALIAQVYPLGVSMPHIDRAERVARRAEAELQGAGLGDDARAALRLNQGSVAYRKGDYEAAERYTREALTLRDRERNPLGWADAAFNLATLRLVRGDADGASEKFEDYVEVFEAELGRMHPEVASGYQNLAVAYSAEDRLDEAYAAVEQAREIRRLTLGEHHPHYAASLNTTGKILLDMGRTEEGMRYSRQSIELLEAHGADPSEAATNRVDLAHALVALGQLDEAEQQAARALEVLERELGSGHPRTSPGHVALAVVAAERGQKQQVLQHMDRAYQVLVSALGDDGLELTQTVGMRATLLARVGEPDRARAELEQWLAERSDPPSEHSTDLLRELADVLWLEPTQREWARTMVTDGRRALADRGLAAPAATLERWLDQHPLP